MEAQFIEYFMERWKKYFSGAELPIVYYYTNHATDKDLAESKNEHRCMIGNLNRVRMGSVYVYNAKTPGCPGGKRYSGFTEKLRPDFEFFLSCGIPGKVEGERYKKSPELVREFMKNNSFFEAPGACLVFKRWDKLSVDEDPIAVLFFASPDVLSGLFTLANYDRADVHGVIAPMGSGCSSIISYPCLEVRAEHPRCVLGMFDVSARLCVPANTLTFAIPMKRFEQMAYNMNESFLTTESWKEVQGRL
jgi:hypothetical protein